MKEYKAPWSGLLKGISWTFAALILGLGIAFAVQGGRLFLLLSLLMIGLLLGCAMFTIRGYTIGPDVLLIRRLLWETRVPLAGLEAARFEPNVMRWSIRLFGNGGAFSFSGYFRNKLLGVYRAYVTHGDFTVVLRFAKRVIVISPETPEEFVKDLAARHPKTTR